MKHKIIALTLSALLLSGCAKPAPQTEASVTETEMSVTAETTTGVSVTTAETTAFETEAVTETAAEATVAEETDPIAQKLWEFISDYESTDLPNNYFLFDFNGDDFPEVAYIGWNMDTPYMNVYDLSGSEPVYLGGTSQGLSPYSDDKECIGLYYNENTGEYFYHSLAHYIIKSSKGYSYVFERFVTSVDFDNHTVEFTPDPTEQRSFDNEADAESYKERIFKELEQCTLVTELKTSYMAENCNDREAFDKMLSDFYSFYTIDKYISTADKYISIANFQSFMDNAVVNGIALNMTPDEVEAILGKPDIAEYEDANGYAIFTMAYENGADLTFTDFKYDGNYVLTHLEFKDFEFNSGLSSKMSRAELIDFFDKLDIILEAEWGEEWNETTVENADRLTIGSYKGLTLIFEMKNDTIENIDIRTFLFY